MTYDIETPARAMAALASRGWTVPYPYEQLAAALYRTWRGRLALSLIRWIARGI